MAPSLTRVLAVAGAIAIVAPVAVLAARGARVDPDPAGGSAAVRAAPPEQRIGTRAVAAARSPRRVDLTIAVSGDLLPHEPVVAAAYEPGTATYDFRPLFAEIRPVIRAADLAICHAETPIGAGPPAGYPRFNAPAALAGAIAWAGWDACTTASNHSVDQGSAGIAATLRALRTAGLRATGTARTRADARRLLHFRVRGVEITLLAYTYGTNGLAVPEPWSVNLIEPRAIVHDAKRARRAGADVVLVNLHWGAEYVHEPTADQQAIARRLLGTGAIDAIVGQHAHVVQPIRRISGRFVVFGEGNLLSNQTSACCIESAQDGLIAILHVRAAKGEAEVRRVQYVPTRVRHPDYVVENVAASLRRLVRRGAGDTPTAAALRASYARTVAVAGKSRLIRPRR